MAAAMAAGEAGGFDLTSLFVSVVPSFSGMAGAMKDAGGAGAEGFQDAFKENFHPFESASETIGEATNMFAKVGSEAAGAFTDAFGSIMKGQMPDIMSGFDAAEDTVKEFVHGSIGEIPLLGAAFDKVFDGITSTLDAFKGPAGEFLDTLLNLGEGWQETARTIAGQTLDTGQIPELLNIVKQLGAEGTPNLEVVSKNIGQVHARLSELDDTQLKELMKTIAQVSELTGTTNLNVQDLTGVMNMFNIPVDKANQTLIELTNISIAAGVPLQQLMSQLSTGGAEAAKAMGYNVEQLGQFLTQMNKAGVQAPQVLAAMKAATSKFIKEGLTPEQGWKDFVIAVQGHFAEGTEAGTKAAEELIRQFFPRVVPQMEDAFKKGLVTLPDATQMLAGIEQPPEQALKATETLEDKLKNLKNILDSALEPLTMGMANALTDVGTKVSAWIQSHQAEILGAVKTVLDQITSWTSTALQIMGRSILAIAPYLNVIKSVTLDLGEAILGLIRPLVSLGALAHLPGFKDAKTDIDDMYGAMQRLKGIDITKDSEVFGNSMLRASGAVDQAGQSMDKVLNPMIQTAQISDAFKQNITDATTGVTAMGDAFQATADGGLQLTGNIDQTKAKLAALGIDVTTGPNGIVTKMTAGNQQIAKQFEDWYKQATGKDLKVGVDIKPHTEQTVTDLMNNAGVPQDFQGPNGVQLPFTLAPSTGFMGGGGPFGGVSPGYGSNMPGGFWPGYGGYGGPLGGPGGPSGGPSAGSGAEAWRPQVRAMIQQYGPQYGIPPDKYQAWEDAIVRQIDTESKGNQGADNPHDTDGKGGTQHVYGLLQYTAGNIETFFPSHSMNDAYNGMAALQAVFPYSRSHGHIGGDGGPIGIGEGHGWQTGGLVRNGLKLDQAIGPGGERWPEPHKQGDFNPWDVLQRNYGLGTPILNQLGGYIQPTGVGDADLMFGVGGMLGFKDGGGVGGEDHYDIWNRILADASTSASLGNTVANWVAKTFGIEKEHNPSWALRQGFKMPHHWAGFDDPGKSMFERIFGDGGGKSWYEQIFGHQTGGLTKFPTGQYIPGSWKPGRDSVHGVLEVGEYVVRRDKAQQHKALLDSINYGYQLGGLAGLGGLKLEGGGQEPGVQERGPGRVGQFLTLAPWWLVGKGVGIPAPPNIGASPFHRKGGPIGFVGGGNVPFPEDGYPGQPDYGVSPEIIAVERIAAQFGLPLISGYRDPGGPAIAGVSAAKSYHGTGEAGDFSDGDKTERELEFAAYMYQNYGAGIAELIHDDPRWSHNINDGRDVGPMGQFYTTSQSGYHGDHVHIAIKHAGGRRAGDSGMGPPGGTPISVPGGPLTGNYDVDRRNERLGNLDREIAHNQDEIRKLDDEIGKKQKILDDKQAELTKLEALSPQEQELRKTEIDKARKARDSAQHEVDSLKERKERLQEGIDTKTREREIAGEEPLKGKREAGREEGYEKQFGQGIIKGMLQELGFPDVFGKDPTQWGITKLAGTAFGDILGMFTGGQGGTSSLGGTSTTGGLGGLLGPLVKMTSPGGLKTAGQIPSVMTPVSPPTGGPLTPGGVHTVNYTFNNADSQTAQANWDAHNANNLSASRWSPSTGPTSTLIV